MKENWDVSSLHNIYKLFILRLKFLLELLIIKLKMISFTEHI